MQSPRVGTPASQRVTPTNQIRKFCKPPGRILGRLIRFHGGDSRHGQVRSGDQKFSLLATTVTQFSVAVTMP